MLLTGIWLWWPHMRFGIGAGGGRPFWYDLHVTAGIVGAVFLVVSGAVMWVKRVPFRDMIPALIATAAVTVIAS